MDGPEDNQYDILSEASHTGKDKYINSVWNLKKKYDTNEHIYKTDS